MGALNNPWSLLFLFLAYGVAGLIEPLVAGYLHHRAPSQFRATVESYQSLAFRVVAAVVGLGFGYISTGHGIHVGFLVLGGMLAAFLIMYMGVVDRISLNGVMHRETA
ncbi:MAG: major facilitator superfamily protein [Bacillota bacterium]|nr:MAG: major facilitator superfamily protein [Bacillota bacterium]